MKLEKQVCAKEYGQKLTELGVTVVSHWSWFKYIEGVFFVDEPWKWPGDLRLPAYTVAELLNVAKGIKGFGMRRGLASWGITPDYLAECIIEDIENNHITVEEINEAK